MDLSPEMQLALDRVSDVCCHRNTLNGITKRLADSVQASHDAVTHAHDAWNQLESLNANMLSIYGLVDTPGMEDLTAAFKEAKLLTRDRVVWQTMGRFRNVFDVMLGITYLEDIVKGDSMYISQLRHAYLKIHCDMLLQMMGRHDCWEAFATNLWHNWGHMDAQHLLAQIQAGLLIERDNDYSSLLQVPALIQRAMCNTKTIMHNAAQLNDGRIAASSDMSIVHRCLESLSRNLSHQQFVEPVRGCLSCSMRSSLLAMQDCVGAWAHLDALSWRATMLAKNAEDGNRKFRQLVHLVEKEIILAGCAYLGSSGFADFGFIEHVLRHEVSFRGMPRVPMGDFLWSLRSTHATMQTELLHELILSEKTWAHLMQKLRKAQPENSVVHPLA